MASTHGYPKWLINCKGDITKSNEWNSFVSELHEAIQQQLTESHVQYFTDLSEPEKELFMQRATKALEGGSTSRNLFNRVSSCMDQHLNEQVSKQLMDDFPTDTKSDLVIEAAEGAAMSLLKKWPDMKNKLHVCFNQPLQEPLRQLAWQLFLSSPRVRKKYVDILNENPRLAISSQDLDISQRVEQMVLAEPTFSDLKGNVGAFYAMKATLSYHHAKKQTNSRLRDTDYFLVVPFVLVGKNSLSRREPASGKVVALLVEEYLTFMNSRPGFVIDAGTPPQNEEMRGFVDKVASILEKNYSSVAAQISKTYVPAREKIVATEKAVLVDGLTELVRPMIRTMLVGYLNFDTLLYVWDQYILGLDTPSFAAEWLSVAVATLLGLQHEKLSKCQTPQEMEAVLNKESPYLTVPQFQYQVKRYHQRDLYALLTSDSKAALPVLDPTQAVHPPWRHWYNDQIPPYTKPQDRRKAREEREIERERLLQQQKDAERKRRQDQDLERKATEGEMMKAVAMERALLDREKIELEEQLAEEKRKRLDEERKAQEEIANLKRELEAMKRPVRSPDPSVFSMSSYISRMLIPPPPTPASMDLPTIPERSPTSPPATANPHEQAEQALLDFLTRVRKSMDKIAHGEGDEAETLDRETQRYIQTNVQDLKRAQMEVFGHRLQPGEFERMEAINQKKYSDQMMALIQKWREDRRAKQLNQGR